MKFLENHRWAPHVLSIELKKAFSYRLNFWVQYLFGTATELGVAYFLWHSIFASQNAERMQGFTFNGIMYYYLFASFSAKITRGNDRGYISQEIYDGGLTRYLLYPLPFVGYKLVTHFSQQLLGMVQLLLALVFLRFALGAPEGGVSLWAFAGGCATCVLMGFLHFAIMSCLELVAFWQDVVWNLMVMLRFALSLLGGGLVPLAFFPDWARHLATLTPFPLLVSFPARVFLGQISLTEWIASVGLAAVWGAAFAFLLAEIWRRGTRQYSGVGI